MPKHKESKMGLKLPTFFGCCKGEDSYVSESEDEEEDMPWQEGKSAKVESDHDNLSEVSVPVSKHIDRQHEKNLEGRDSKSGGQNFDKGHGHKTVNKLSNEEREKIILAQEVFGSFVPPKKQSPRTNHRVLTTKKKNGEFQPLKVQTVATVHNEEQYKVRDGEVTPMKTHIQPLTPDNLDDIFGTGFDPGDSTSSGQRYIKKGYISTRKHGSRNGESKKKPRP